MYSSVIISAEYKKATMGCQIFLGVKYGPVALEETSDVNRTSLLSLCLIPDPNFSTDLKSCHFKSCIVIKYFSYMFFSNRSFVESFNSLIPEKPWVTKLSSAGLIYLHFGRRVLGELTQLKQEDRQLEVLYEKVSLLKTLSRDAARTSF